MSEAAPAWRSVDDVFRWVRALINLGAQTATALIKETVVGGDCNGNGVSDARDIAGGTSADCNENGIPDECDADCDEDGLPDPCEILANPGLDLNDDAVLDGCQSQGDLDGDGAVTSADLVLVLLGWGPYSDAPGCSGDATFDGSVDVTDLIRVIANWG